MQHSAKSSLEPALGSIVVLTGVVGLVIAGYFMASDADSSNRGTPKAVTAANSPSATPRINFNATAGNPEEACTKSVKGSPSYSLRAGATFTYTRNVLTTKTGLTQWSISGFAEDYAGAKAHVNFNCTIEKTQTGSWSVSYTVAP
ncbi:hypothetical protein [Arthrobacter sp. NPDC057013]